MSATIYLHWKWGSDQHDNFGIVEVILNPTEELSEEDLAQAGPPIHLSRTEMDTLFYQLAGINLIPKMVGPDGPIAMAAKAKRLMEEAKPAKKGMTNQQAVVGLLILICAFWLIVGPLLWFFRK